MATAVIRYEPHVDEPLAKPQDPARFFEDRADSFDHYNGSFMLYGLDHEAAKKSVTDLVCDAIWEMGFDVKPQFFSKVSRLSKLPNAPLVCDLLNEHQKLGVEILEALEDLKRIKLKLINSVKEVVVSQYSPPPPQFMLHFKKRFGKNADATELVLDALKNLGIEATAENITKANIVMDRYNCIVCEVSQNTIARKFYNYRKFISYMEKCPVKSISFYREAQDYYYDRTLVVTGLNSKRKDCTALFLEMCSDLGVDLPESEIVRCEWLYGKAFQSKALRSPLVVKFGSEDARIAVYKAAREENKIRQELRLKVKPRKRKVHKPEGVEGEEEKEEEAKPGDDENVEDTPEGDGGPIYRRIYVNPFISLPHSLLYTAAKDFTKRNRRFTCLPMTFYGRIRLQLKEPKARPAPTEDENAASAVDELAEKLKSLSMDGKTVVIRTPADLWNLDRKFKSNAIEKYYMITDPYYKDVGYTLEPYEWFSLPRDNQKRLTRKQLTYEENRK